MHLTFIILFFPFLAFSMGQEKFNSLCLKIHKGDCDLVSAIAYVESRYKADALNAGEGSYGIMQIRCTTAKMIGFNGICDDLLKPHINIEYATKYLRQIKSKYIKLTDVIASYNSGKPIICKNYNEGKCRAGQYYNQKYVDSVMDKYIELKFQNIMMAYNQGR